MKRGDSMKTIEATIPDQLDCEIEALVEKGWYASRHAVLREAISRFLAGHRPELMEEFVREDVEWGLRRGS